jgi:hypothetical protein
MATANSTWASRNLKAGAGMRRRHTAPMAMLLYIASTRGDLPPVAVPSGIDSFLLTRYSATGLWQGHKGFFRRNPFTRRGAGRREATADRVPDQRKGRRGDPRRERPHPPADSGILAAAGRSALLPLRLCGWLSFERRAENERRLLSNRCAGGTCRRNRPSDSGNRCSRHVRRRRSRPRGRPSRASPLHVHH